MVAVRSVAYGVYAIAFYAVRTYVASAETTIDQWSVANAD
jgi:hypothetical protein